MSNSRFSQVSFSRGEITPALYNRTDMEQRSIALKTLENGFINQECCVSNRSGFEYVGEVKDSTKETRLIPFSFSNNQTYIIEAGEEYFRILQNGGYIYYPDDYGEKVTIEGYVICMEYTHDGVVYNFALFEGPNHTGDRLAVIKEIGVTGSRALLFSNGVVNPTPYILAEVIPSSAVSSGNPVSTYYYLKSEYDKRGQIVEVQTPYLANELQNIKYTQSADVLTLCHINHPPKTLSRYSNYDWRLEDIIFQPSIDAPTGVSVVWTGSTSSNTKTYKFCVTAVDSTSNDESTTSEIISAKGHKEAYWTTSEYFTISWSAVTGASEYNIYKEVNGIFGYIGTSQSTSFVDTLIEPDTSATAPTVNNPFEDNNNPSCCSYFQQRKLYANTTNKPQTLYASRTSNFNNFNYSRPLSSTDSIEIALLDKEINEIKHLIAFKDLIVLTSNNEYKVNGTDGVFQATPPPASVIQSCYGASDVQPVISGNMVLFVQSGGTVLRDLGYDYLSDAYKGIELSIFANHIFEGKEVKYLSYAKEPYRLVYVIFTDGTMAVLTYNKDQQILGWARWITEGSFVSAATIREGQEDITYFIIQRGNKKLIERQKTRIVRNAKYGFFLDSAMTHEFETAVSTLSGLGHLAGKTVNALLDGGVVEKLTVANNGTLTLPYSAKIITVGLPYTFRMETLGVEGDNSHGLKKILSAVSIGVLNSREDFFVESNTGIPEQMTRGLESINDSGKLYSGSKKATPLNEPSEFATIKIYQKYPLPLTITSVSAIINVEDISDGADA